MPCSPARIEANRRNALRSTGPRTEAGKARSRANGVTHGLTGAGVALPDEDAAEVERRFAALGEELGPRTERERIMARRAAFLSVRLERCARYEAATLSGAIRGAEADHDEDRLRAVEAWAGRLAERPAAAVRELARTPEGIDWMIRAWDDLMGDLVVTRTWHFAHVARAENLQGRHADELGMSRVAALASALHGDFRFADPDGPAFTEVGPDRDARVEAARSAIAAIIDDEKGRLRKLRAALSADDLARDRAEAPARRLFDPSDAFARFRRYESAAAREMYRLFAHFDQRAEPATVGPEPGCAELGSVCRADVGADHAAIGDDLAPAPAPAGSIRPATSPGPEPEPGRSPTPVAAAPAGPIGEVSASRRGRPGPLPGDAIDVVVGRRAGPAPAPVGSWA